MENIRTLDCGIELKLVDKESDLFLDMALSILDVITRCGRENRECGIIVPVGPTDQYPVLAEVINHLDISLKHVHFFNMDEYLITPTQPIAPDHFMSFHARMNSEFYSRVRPDLVMPESHRHFPEPGHEADYDQMIAQIGNAEACFGGLGINGHIAFNEPAEANDPISPEDFAALGTRVLPISRETRTINAYGYQRGDLRGMPEYCITVGMKQILAAKSVYIALNRDWQHGIAKHVFADPIQAQIPATLLRTRPNVRFVTTRAIGDGLC